MREKILKLREEGKSYNQIKEILGCSKGTIAYHCGDGQKEKSKNRSQGWKKKNTLKVKALNSNGHYPLNKRVNDFKRRSGSKKDIVNSNILKASEVFEKFKDQKHCSLTGRSIDLNNPNSYHLDHIIPCSKGGSNNIENLQIVCKEANIAKSDLSLQDFIKLCKEVLEYNGFNVKESGGS